MVLSLCKRALVYLGIPFYSKLIEVPKRHLRQATKDQKINFEMRYIAALPPYMRDRAGLIP